MTMAKEIVQAGLPAGVAKGIGGAFSDTVATGSVQGDAAVLTSSLTTVTAADGTKGVILPAGEVGDEFWVFNSSGSTLKVYPPLGSAISVAGTGLGTVNAAFSQLTQKSTMYKIVKTTQVFAVTSA